jgi:DNA-binding CsgD family transcriptional regulator
VSIFPPDMAENERLYAQVWPSSGAAVTDIAERLRTTPEALREELSVFFGTGVVWEVDGRLMVAPPHVAIANAMQRYSQRLTQLAGDVERLAARVPALGEVTATAPRPVGAGPPGVSVEGETLAEADVPMMLRTIIERTAGSISFFRPDQWRLPSESDMAMVIAAAAGRGRRVRAIYPFHALKDAPQVLAARAAIGEEVRLIVDVPTRLAIMGVGYALVPDPPGVGSDRVILIRQPSLVRIVQDYFDSVWEQGVPGPGSPESGVRVGDQSVLVRHLTAGMKDEQIARSMGVSLRTVRRRIAALLAELGVDSRFAAGVEAARRGWV